jgi:hypothetical protein
MGFTNKKTIFLAATISTTNFLRFSEKKSSKSPKNSPHHLPKWIFPLPHASQQKNNKQKNKHYSLVKEFIGTTTDRKMEQKQQLNTFGMLFA